MFDALANVETIVSRLAETSDACERGRRISDEAVALMRDAGMARLMVPKRYGGCELPPRAHFLTVARLSHACPAAAWVHMVCGAHTFMVGRFPEQLLEEIFGDSPDVLIPGTPAAQGTCVRTDGGFILNGRWQFCSGVDHGPWIIVGARGIPDAAGQPTPDLMMVMPVGDIVVHDTWHVLGMRGTGSKDIEAKDLFVPAHRTVAVAEALPGTVPGVDGALYRLPILSFNATAAASAVLGIAERGMREFVAQTRVRQDIYIGGGKRKSVGLQMRIAEATMEISLARTLIEKNCTLMDDFMQMTGPVDLEGKMAMRWNAGYAVELCRRATERMYAAAGAHATHDSNPLQQMHRDINMTTHHAIFEFDMLAENYGRLAVGLEATHAFI
jgi:alkylation response protein AidB-like acyl-CoA dehydrogenase